MPEFCSCGTQLPEEAWFCHKCGKPQREITKPEEPYSAPDAAVALPVSKRIPAAGPSFRHPVALRVGLFAAAAGTLLCLLLPRGFVLWLPAAGFLSVLLFTRRTGQFLTVRGGARMGWITGLISFAIVALIFTAWAVSVSRQPGGFPAFYREAAKTAQIPDKTVEQLAEMLSHPSGQAATYSTMMFLFFGIITAFCTAGGALGPKVLAKGAG